MANTSNFKNGLCIEFNDDIYTIISFQHVKPGKGGAFVRTKLKSLTNGKVIENTFNAGIKITTARIEKGKYQFLYKNKSEYHFMNNDNFDQIILSKEQINSPQFLKEGQDVEITIHQETNKILGCELPPFVKLKVIYTEPGYKGDTATKTFKPAKLETEAQIQVPLFINIGDEIKIDTRTSEYSERIK